MDRMQRTQMRLWIGTLGLSAVLCVGYAIGQDSAKLLSPLDPQKAVTQPVQSPQATQKVKPVLDADLIRVGISDDNMTEMEYPSSTITATGPYKVSMKSSGKVVFLGKADQQIKVAKNGSGFLLFEGASPKGLGPFNDVLKVEPVGAGQLKITSVTRKKIIPTYRGIFELMPGYSSPSKFTVVNVLPMQDYLKAVVPNELPYSYGYEAVKAQSVAARNYAIHPREKPWPQFDICDSQYCQAYYGANTEHPQTTKALAETQGLVALFNGEPLLALYSSSHGGYSENYENAFSDPITNKYPGTPIPYLKGGPDVGTVQDLSNEDAARAFYTGRPHSFDVNSPNYRWQKQWTRAELESIINTNLAAAAKDKVTAPFIQPAFPSGSSIGELKALVADQRGVSGKIMQLRIIGTNGVWTLKKEFVIRKVLQHNGKFLPSANLVFNHNRDADGRLLGVKATGGGFGHGVGMSQLGASYLSKNGHEFVDILQHYYKGAAIGTIPIMASTGQGMKTSFYVDRPQGTLNITSKTTQPVKVSINGKDISVTPNPQGHNKLSVASFLKPQSLNTLVVHPLATAGEPVKAWIEVVEPKTTAAIGSPKQTANNPKF